MTNKGFFNVRTAIGCFVFFMCMNLLINGSPYGLAKLVALTNGHSILDMEFGGYSVDRAYEILGALGAEGRNFAMKYIVPLDFPFPLSYGLFYFVTLTLLGKSILKNLKNPWLFGIVGAAAALFDWLENIMVIILLRNYPRRLAGVATTASVFTQLKALFIISSIVLIMAGLIAVLIHKLFVKKTEAG